MKSPTILLIFRLFFKATRKMDLLCPGKREFLKLTASRFLGVSPHGGRPQRRDLRGPIK